MQSTSSATKVLRRLCASCQHHHHRRRSALAFSTSAAVHQQPFKVLFCGSDEFSIASLKSLQEAKDVWESIHVLTPRSRLVGRGGRKVPNREIYIPPLHTYAEEQGLPLSQMPFVIDQPRQRKKKVPTPVEKPRFASPSWTFPEPFDTSDPSHLLVTASFGYIIPSPLLQLFSPHQRLNVHPSLLPRWRGAAPIQWTIASGDAETGVTVQTLGERVDAGEILGQRRGVVVPEEATYETLLPPLAAIGGELLVDVLRKIQSGEAKGQPQDPDLVTRAPKIGPETGHIPWLSTSAPELARLSRAITHQHPLWTELYGTRLQLFSLRALHLSEIPTRLTMNDHKPGTAFLDSGPIGKGERLVVACVPEGVEWRHLEQQGHSWVEVREIKPEGKRKMGVREWWNGLKPADRKRNWVHFKARRFLDEEERDGEEEGEGGI